MDEPAIMKSFIRLARKDSHLWLQQVGIDLKFWNSEYRRERRNVSRWYRPLPTAVVTCLLILIIASRSLGGPASQLSAVLLKVRVLGEEGQPLPNAVWGLWDVGSGRFRKSQRKLNGKGEGELRTRLKVGVQYRLQADYKPSAGREPLKEMTPPFTTDDLKNGSRVWEIRLPVGTSQSPAEAEQQRVGTEPTPVQPGQSALQPSSGSGEDSAAIRAAALQAHQLLKADLEKIQARLEDTLPKVIRTQLDQAARTQSDYGIYILSILSLAVAVTVLCIFLSILPHLKVADQNYEGILRILSQPVVSQTGSGKTSGQDNITIFTLLNDIKYHVLTLVRSLPAIFSPPPSPPPPDNPSIPAAPIESPAQYSPPPAMLQPSSRDGDKLEPDHAKNLMAAGFLDEFEQVLSSGNPDLYPDMEILNSAKCSWPNVVKSLLRGRQKQALVKKPQTVGSISPPEAAPSPAGPPPRRPAGVTGTDESRVLQVYKDGLSKESSPESRRWLASVVGVEDAKIRWCQVGDWVAIPSSDRHRTGYYAIPNPFTARESRVDRLTKFYPMDPDARRSEYCLKRLAWIAAPVLEKAQFEIDTVEATWEAEGAMGEVIDTR